MNNNIKEKEAEAAKFKSIIELDMKIRIEEMSHAWEEARIRYEDEITSLLKSKAEAQEGHEKSL